MSSKHVPPPDFDPSSYETPVKRACVATEVTMATPSTLASTTMGSANTFASMSTGSSDAFKPSPMETSAFNPFTANATAGASAPTPSVVANNTSVAAVAKTNPAPASNHAVAELLLSSDDESEEEPLKEGESPKLEMLDLLNYDQVSSFIDNTYDLDGDAVPTSLDACWDLIFNETQPWMLKAFLMRYKPKAAVPTQKKAVVAKLKKQLVKLSKKRDHDTAMKQPGNEATQSPPANKKVSKAATSADSVGAMALKSVSAPSKQSFGPPIPAKLPEGKR